MIVNRVVKSLLCMSLMNLSSFSQGNLAYKPNWYTGQRWRIEVKRMSFILDPKPEDWRPKQLTSIYEFEVEDNIEVDGEYCIPIIVKKISFQGQLSDPRNYYRLVMRKSDLSIKECRKIFIKTKSIKVIGSYKESGAVDIGMESHALVLPVFEDESIMNDSARKERYSKAIKKTDFRYCLQREAFTKILANNGTEIETLLFMFENVYMSKKATQLWIKGKPWWSEATYFNDEGLCVSARLIEPEEKAEAQKKDVEMGLRLPEKTQSIICDEFWKIKRGQ
ncbi:hypothetical protein P4C99_21850 [Pontiellaceae bacterium B1224]|nr:hypothetical protein [Pontiellaceae bacterium B1224]